MHVRTVRRYGLPAAILLLLIVMAVAPALALAGDSPSPAASGAPVIYRVGLPSDVDNMNPFSTYNTIPWECFRIGYNFLTWYDADYEPVPDLADRGAHAGERRHHRGRQGLDLPPPPQRQVERRPAAHREATSPTRTTASCARSSACTSATSPT